MRKLLVVFGLVVATAALAASPTRYLYEYSANGTAQPCSAGSCTRSAPTSPSDGMLLANLRGYRVQVCAASGQTLSGGGTLQAWAYNYAEGAWMRTPDLDQSITASGVRCQSFPDFALAVSSDARVLFAASSVTVSGGSGLDVLIEGY